MRVTLLAVAALAFLRIVVGTHFFLEGLSHLRSPDWSSAGFRKAAVGPWAGWFRSGLPETGDWSATLGRADGRGVDEPLQAWKQSVTDGWRRHLDARQKLVPLDGDGRAEAERQLAAATAALDDFASGIRDELAEYRLESERLDAMERAPTSTAVPFARERVAKKRKELSGQAAGWMQDAAAIGTKLVAAWDEPRSTAERLRLEEAVEKSKLWKADRFVSWSLVTIGGCLVLGLLVKFNAMGGACFLASVIASQPFWVPGAQATYDQWVELAALLALASLPTGGWSGLDFFLRRLLSRACPWFACCREGPAGDAA